MYIRIYGLFGTFDTMTVTSIPINVLYFQFKEEIISRTSWLDFNRELYSPDPTTSHKHVF